ncbi:MULTISPECIES: hypothetical protein [Allobacillus]|uniref:Sporulation protein YhaL n=1 Tax=Allobacillus halotolerans TaxID=570278 RepID=A0ABS6GML4_9BACI|nr:MULTISPECIES: hypothetical protein [Allobacillus]MBU6080369.1 hypothetical protein [Allobacillus halotolerans]TSJ61923.1 hypothetical protein FPQ10_12025 [Allobacillus sp. SKP2-8]
MPFIQFPILMPFLYFPDDKTEYLPALLTMIGFFIVAVLAFILIKKISKKQEDKFNERYGPVIQEKEEKDQTDKN